MWLDSGYVFVSFDVTMSDPTGSGPQFVFVLTPDALVLRALLVQNDTNAEMVAHRRGRTEIPGIPEGAVGA